MVSYTDEDVTELYKMINPLDPASNPNNFAISIKLGQKSLFVDPRIDTDDLLRQAVRFIAKKDEFYRFLCIAYDLPLEDMLLYINADDKSKIIAHWRLKIGK